jgi:class 3 adenylate cyclase/CHASE3 domain sensor protein
MPRDEPPIETKPPSNRSRSGDGDGVPALLRPFVDFVAGIQARLETKLLVGFLGISVLMLTLGVVSLFVVNRMDSQVDRLSVLVDQRDRAQEMLYSITSQSHFRTMALLTSEPVWDEKIIAAKENFSSLLANARANAISAENEQLFDELSGIDQRYADAGERVEQLQVADDIDGALQVHIQSEHEISHELEDLLNELMRGTEAMVASEIGGLGGFRNFLTFALAVFSAMSLLGAVALGAIISWTVILPVRKIDSALDTLASGDFTARVDVPNRDEFGKLSENVNRASEQLEVLYGRLETVNRDLQAKVDEQVAMLERASHLRRYLSPAIADAVVTQGAELGATTRAELTVVFADIRGFTALSEQSEPEAVATNLNTFLTAMTEVVFDHGGTLDKYVGDAIMVFFNDPLPQEDHAERAVRMALEMQRVLDQLCRSMSKAALGEITAGIGISTGYVTVGNFGSPNRMEYTVIGNHVNLASRLADEAAPGEILISERTLALLPGDLVDAKPAGERTLKGVNRPIRLYSITDIAYSVDA